ncbi:MAG: hypothetical protein GY892_19215 [Shimia sp.]|nr:hypothetical protein [Shimia sp.]
MGRRFFSADPATGIKKYWHVKDNGEYAVETEQTIDVDTVNARQRNMADKRTKWGDVNKVASIPLSVYYSLKAKGIADDPAALKKWLNNPDNRVFRTREGTV